MDKRGHCRCGTLLVFRMTRQGYKTRCPGCQSVVRLREEAVRTSVPEMRPGVLTPPPLSKTALRKLCPPPVPNANEAPDATPMEFNALDTHDDALGAEFVEMKAPRQRKRSSFWHRHGAWVIVGVMLGVVMGLIGIALL